MNVHQSIERQEREFKGLLQKAMQAPLSPLTDSIQEINERMDQLEELVREMREIELCTLSLGAEDTRKLIRSLKSISEETPREVHGVLLPLFEQLQTQLEQRMQQGINQLATDLMGQLQHTELQAANYTVVLKDTIVASQGAIESSQRQGFEYLGNLQQMTLTQLHTECESLRSDVGDKHAQQSADGKRAVVHVQELLSRHSQEIERQSSNSLRQLREEADTRMSQIALCMEELNTVLNTQKLQLERLQQEQVTSSERLGEQLHHALLPLRKWAIGSVCVAATSLASLLALVVWKL